MVFVLAWLIFVALAAACWSVSLACLRGTGDGTEVAAVPHRPTTAVAAVLAVSVTSFVPFPVGWAAGLIAWGVAAFDGLSLPARRAAVLFAYLAVGSLLTRLLVLGVVAMFGL
jgi:hypothetical protein